MFNDNYWDESPPILVIYGEQGVPDAVQRVCDRGPPLPRDALVISMDPHQVRIATELRDASRGADAIEFISSFGRMRMDDVILIELDR